MGKESKQPTNWPSNIIYLSSNTPSKFLSPDQRKTYCSPLPDPPQSLSLIKSIKICPISDPSHPAFGQFGLFARSKLLRGSWVVDYLGFLHTEAESDPKSDYDLSLDSTLGLSVDASTSGTEARFVNDYRGISEKGPNVEFRTRSIVVQGIERIGMSIYTLKDIKKGEELLLSYGRGFWQERRREQEVETGEEV